MTSSRLGGGQPGKKWSKFRRKWIVTGRRGGGDPQKLDVQTLISIGVIRVQTVFQTGVWFCYKCSRLVPGSAIKVRRVSLSFNAEY